MNRGKRIVRLCLMTKLVKVNTLPVAERWKRKLVSEKNISEKRIGIWELPYQTKSDYSYSSKVRYVVGNVQAVKSRVSHLGERVDVL